MEANAKTLRENCVPCEETTLARIYVQDKLVGYAFATRWPHHERDGMLMIIAIVGAKYSLALQVMCAGSPRW